MPIRNKDGSLFKTLGPNPVMSEQEFWGEFVLHNFFHQEETTKEADDVEYQRIEDIEPIEVKVQIKELPKDKPDILLAYCMPSIIIEVEDPVYREVRTSLTYGPQFTFQVVMKQQTDMTIQFWTNATAEFNRGSILYIPKQGRWWRVEGVEQSNNGKIMNCGLSSLQPSFAT
jgi:hypothetical protein